MVRGTRVKKRFAGRSLARVFWWRAAALLVSPEGEPSARHASALAEGSSKHGPVPYHNGHPDHREFCAQAEAFSQMLRCAK